MVVYGDVRLFYGTVRSGSVVLRSCSIEHGPLRQLNGRLRLFNGPEWSGTVGFGRLRSFTVVLRSGTVRYGRFTVGNGLERFGSETLFYACGSCTKKS
jgi:hypothetical protein